MVGFNYLKTVNLRTIGKTISSFAIRFLTVIFLISLTYPRLGFCEEPDYWAATGLSDAHLKNFLTQKRCYSSETSFLGCIAAANGLLTRGYPRKILTNKSIENMNFMGNVVSTVERLKIQELKSAVTLESLKIMNESWSKVYQLTIKNQISFEKIWDKGLAYTSQTQRSAKISYVINQYYMTAIDPHTRIIAVKEREQTLNTSESSIVGVGIDISKAQDKIIIRPKTGGSAFAAGIKPNDILQKVDDSDVRDLSTSEISSLIKGTENTKVTLTVYRDGREISLDMLRAKFVEKNIELQILNDPIDKSRIGYIKIRSFSDIGLCQRFKASAIALYNQNAKSLILDLRGNLGGLVSEAECIASTYIDYGNVILTENDIATNKVQITFKSSDDSASLYNLYGRKPLVILIDSQSASASEIVSGALRSQKRAILIGEKSYGKGTVQSQLPWKEIGMNFSDLKNVAIMKTVYRFHFSNGETNQLVGLTPDIEAHSDVATVQSLREADLYTNAVSTISHEPYKPGKEIQSIEACITQRNMLNSPYAEKINSHLVPDYPMSVAREAASCL